jgi:hypothetical protein
MKKIFSTAICLGLLATIANAQVYTINPIYTVKTVDVDRSTLSIASIDSFSRESFIVDLDKMTFTNPVTILSSPEVIGIKKVTRLDNNLIQLKLKKDNRYSPELYYLQLDAAGNPLYIQNADVIFTTYTTTASALILRKKCTRIKKVEVPYTEGENPPDDSSQKAMTAAKYIEGYNAWELKNGVVIWTEGKGKNAIVHTITITSSGAYNKKNYEYVQLIGKDETGRDCNVVFIDDRTGNPAYYHIKFERIESNSWTTMSFY